MIAIQKATLKDANLLTEIMKTTFDAEAEMWIKDNSIVDYNIQPPGYGSLEMTRYMIEDLEYYKILLDSKVIGGIILTLTGTSFGRVDRVFILPEYQGNQFGTKAMQWIEEAFPTVAIWELETSARQINNHAFYEKVGYHLTFQTDEEYHYLKRMPVSNDLQLNYSSEFPASKEFYQINQENVVFANSNLIGFQASNCNFYQSKFRNINYRESRFSDLNFAGSIFSLTSLGGVQFKDADLGYEATPISFERCDIQGTTMDNCNLKGLTIRDSDIEGMTIDGIAIDELVKAYKEKLSLSKT